MSRNQPSSSIHSKGKQRPISRIEIAAYLSAGALISAVGLTFVDSPNATAAGNASSATTSAQTPPNESSTSAPSTASPASGTPATNSSTPGATAPGVKSNIETAQLAVTEEYARKTFEKVNEFVRKEFFDARVSSDVWPEIASRHRSEIEKSRDLRQLTASINAALAELKVSHTQFATVNDEHYYFLKNLFSSFQPDKKTPIGPYLGMGLGGPGFKENQVRYVLDAGPAFAAGVKRGDFIEKVNGKELQGLLTFAATEAKEPVELTISRGGQTYNLTIKPTREDYYEAFLEASRKSARIFNTPSGPVGYMRLWCGGKSGEVLEEVMTDKMMNTSAMILDLRDGYGGNSLEDLDIFYRPAAGYPAFKTFGRRGRTHIHQVAYTKPLIVIINGGSRSGKELLAYGVKNSKRATLVGENTAGAVLAGRLFSIDDRSALYLAVLDGTLNGTRLEGVGVAPHIKCTFPATSTKDTQLEAALNTANDAISKSRSVAGKNTAGRITQASARR